MKTTFLNFDSQNSSINRQTSFKRGLPSWFIRETKTANPYRIEAELADKGISADFGGVPTVAMCCKKVVEIMEHYGFELPSKFSFEPLEYKTLGTYSSYQDKVCINSNMKEFQDVVKQNRLEERQGSYHPRTGHFLQTYLHEFSHAAHYKNLCNRFGDSEANRIFWGYLTNNSPARMMIDPLNTTLRFLVTKPFLKWAIDKVIPPREGLYAKSDLCEFIAEKNARIIAEDLGDNLTLRYNDRIPFEQSPDYWDPTEEWKNGEFETVISKMFKYFDKDIWNGDINKLDSTRSIMTHFRN